MEDKPEMTVIGRHPALVAHLSTIDGAYMHCKLSNGQDAYVPLREVLALFEQDIVSKLRASGGQVYGK